MGSAAYEASLGTELREMRKVAKVVFTFNLKDSTGTKNSIVGVHSAKVAAIIPEKAIVTHVWYDVVNTFTSSTDAATIGISLQGSGNILAPVAISNGANAFDAGFHDTLIHLPTDLSHFLKMTENRKVLFTVGGGQSLTAGKLVLFVEYVVSE